MISLTSKLIAVGVIGLGMLYLLFVPHLSWNWKSARAQFATGNRSGAFFLSLTTLLSFAAVVFSVHALLVVHGVVK